MEKSGVCPVDSNNAVANQYVDVDDCNDGEVRQMNLRELESELLRTVGAV